MNELTHLSLFSGIGGLDIAAHWAGMKTVGMCEWADYPHEPYDNSFVCVNAESENCTEWVDEYGSCQYCERRY